MMFFWGRGEGSNFWYWVWEPCCTQFALDWRIVWFWFVFWVKDIGEQVWITSTIAGESTSTTSHVLDPWQLRADGLWNAGHDEGSWGTWLFEGGVELYMKIALILCFLYYRMIPKFKEANKLPPKKELLNL